ncbi:hypothetical protein LTR47_005611 [Exophiala xenobiotica]|nr:hypothetical protein LTR47_005611 [Exophiala xenobiotica]KAK5349182.1 hypothetical protein LTR61_007220 [Exophiala xenobiotica]KAK5365671.1 hypothetical protein LTR11_008553 [Exophiala xenobiotica]
MPSFEVLEDASFELREEPPKATSRSNPRDDRDNRLVHVIEPVKGIKAITRDHTRSSR